MRFPRAELLDRRRHRGRGPGLSNGKESSTSWGEAAFQGTSDSHSKSVANNQDALKNAKFRRIGGAAAIIVLTVLAYLPALSGKFVWDDDSWTTVICRIIKEFRRIAFHLVPAHRLQQYYPLTGTTFWLDYHLWGFRPLPYHVENLLLHIVAALLFWAVVAAVAGAGSLAGRSALRAASGDG